MSAVRVQGVTAPLPHGHPFECFARGWDGVLNRKSPTKLHTMCRVAVMHTALSTRQGHSHGP